MRTRNLIVGIFALFLLSACSTTQVLTDRNTNFDFNEVKTYKIVYDTVNHKSNVVINDIHRQRIENSINKQMALRGLSESNTPDVYIYYHAGVEHMRNYSTSSTYHAPYYGRRGYWGGYGHGHSSTTEYITTDGTLTLEMVCAKQAELVWYASGTETLKSNYRNKEEHLDKAIDLIMQEFPMQKQVAETTTK